MRPSSLNKLSDSAASSSPVDSIRDGVTASADVLTSPESMSFFPLTFAKHLDTACTSRYNSESFSFIGTNSGDASSGRYTNHQNQNSIHPKNNWIANNFTTTMSNDTPESRTPSFPLSQNLSSTGGQESSSSDSRDKAPAAGPLHHQNILMSDPQIHHPRLTLSAFRRPERTIRLTNSDPRRLLSDYYNLYGPGCRVLGHGAFSTVRSALSRNGKQKVAVKTIAKHEALRSRRLRVTNNHSISSGGERGCSSKKKSYMEEWEILRRFQYHPHVINLLDVFETDDEIQLVLEYCRGGELFDAIQEMRKQRAAQASNITSSTNRGLTEAQAAQITAQILSALADLHKAGIVHRDVKAENILLVNRESIWNDDNKDSFLHVKLCDFGMARSLFQEEEESTSTSSDGEESPTSPCICRSFSIVGSNYYMAPEVGDGEGYSTAVDLYSLGVTLYILLCGFPPVFSGGDHDDSSSLDHKVLFPVDHNISEPAKRLVEKLLRCNADERITAKQALQDPWIKMYASTLPTAADSSTKSPVSSSGLSSSFRVGGLVVKAPSPVVDVDDPSVLQSLEVVRNCLYQTIGSSNSKRSHNNTINSSKAAVTPRPLKRLKKHPRRSSSCLIALSDLFQQVTSPAALTISSPSKASKTPQVSFASAVLVTSANTTPAAALSPTSSTTSTQSLYSGMVVEPTTSTVKHQVHFL